ncbi:DarT1-associated NADAR antitoxin family protein, partial [Staphylococcus cohnii]
SKHPFHISTIFRFSSISTRHKCSAKSIEDLHQQFLKENITDNLLEVSSKSIEDIGIKASAFNLKIKTIKGHLFCVEQVFSGLLLSLLEIMEESNDPATRDRLDEEIKEVMKELNLTWEDIG